MNTLLILLFCALVSLVLTALFFSILWPRRQRNQRSHRLGRWLAFHGSIRRA